MPIKQQDSLPELLSVQVALPQNNYRLQLRIPLPLSCTNCALACI
ncbi:MAG TPA: hypothetical protein PLZ29_11845 [Spirochaetota bacterium]|nr:hypothetical protein [Spirochaetota bacterium]